MQSRPRILITLGDVAGIGPEIIARGWPELLGFCRPIIVGDRRWIERALKLTGRRACCCVVGSPAEVEPAPDLVPCIQGSKQELAHVQPGRVDAAAGRAAYDFLCTAIDLSLNRQVAAIVTAPLHKEGLRAAGLPYPGHTEILAEKTGARQHAMMLYCDGLGVVHVTLHVALREVFSRLTRQTVEEKIKLLNTQMTRLCGRPPRIGVAALNPHASDGGMFGDEEATIIRPAVEAAQADGLTVSGPWPSDTMFVRARAGEFDGIVAMYHDQGHIAFKLFGGLRNVNITLGLPIVRTSVAHGTAYEIAGQGVADPLSLIEAARVAVRLAC